MLDLSAFTGPACFGPAYQIMYENATHARGSVDRMLVERMVQVCPETLEFLYGTPPSSPAGSYGTIGRPQLESMAKSRCRASNGPADLVERVAGLTSGIARKHVFDLGTAVFGGFEEDILARGSDWCADLARVACSLYQLRGLPARLVFTADTRKAYTGHVLVEAWYDDAWGVVDATDGTLHRVGGRPVSVWDLLRKPPVSREFTVAAIASYDIAGWREYDYSTSGVNSYYRSVLQMSIQGWPGGLRWLFGEASGSV